MQQRPGFGQAHLEIGFKGAGTLGLPIFFFFFFGCCCFSVIA